MSTPRNFPCPSCAEQVSADSRFCSSCGQVLVPLSQMATAAPEVPQKPESPAARPTSSSSIPVGGFTPGTILADRYRIVGLVGRGGMGEVYRADDLKLGQPVALKFLPRSLSDDPVRRERFFAEVRITRQLSHPNICRVYDIAEFEGQHFLSMEFIDGEDLASLVRRIGYLTTEKALDIARQLVAGLAAAHERGVLHRDLKPANIMLDGHGRVRITDFGIAIAMEDDTQAAEISGTPAYMAPEQLAGKGATVRSDIYALGLILYEIVCGKRAFTATTIAELREQKAGLTPRAPSEIRSAVDPILERLITRCIDRDPRGRPDSARQLGAALPGGDPLAAAIAAGETPSPEMVAASSLKEGLHPALAVALVAVVILGLLGIAAFNPKGQFFQLVPGMAPELLADRARGFLSKAGYANNPVDRVFGYTGAPLTQVDKLTTIPNAAHIRAISGLNVWLWYRESSQSLQHWTTSGVTVADPPMSYPGEALVQLDTEGRLRSLRVMPVEGGPAPDSSPEAVWSLLFNAAGFDESKFTRTEIQQVPPSYADASAAWQGTLPQAPEISIGIEAAMHRGRPVYFEIASPWNEVAGASTTGVGALFWLVPLVLMAGALFLVRQNLQLGRGDRRGAAKLTALSLGLSALSWILTEHHVGVGEGSLILLFARSAILQATVVWVLYVALEPVIRRRRPQSLISWTRLLSGEWRDPLVGRDVLAGCAAGVILALGRARSLAQDPVVGILPGGVLGTRFFISDVLETLGASVVVALAFLVVFFLVRRLLRRDWVVVLALVLIMVALILPNGGTISLPLVPVAVLLMVFLPLRLGLLASTVGLFVLLLAASSPITFDTSVWYFDTGLATFLLIVGLSLYGFRVALGGRRLLRASTED